MQLSYTVLFHMKKKRKTTKNLSKHVIENLFLLCAVIGHEHGGTQHTRVYKARQHVST